MHNKTFVPHENFGPLRPSSRKLVARFDPLRFPVFGSFARGGNAGAQYFSIRHFQCLATKISV